MPQSVKHLTLISAQVMISSFVRLIPALGSVLTVGKLLRIFSPPLSLRLPHSLFLSLSSLRINKHKKIKLKYQITLIHLKLI